MLILGLTLVCLMGVMYFIATRIMMGGFSEVENADTTRNIERFRDAIGDEATELDRITNDWASWDDTYTFIEDRNAEFVSSNLDTESSWINNRLNLMMLINATGRIEYENSFDLGQETWAPVPESVTQLIDKNSDSLLSHPDIKSGTKGLVILPEGPMLISSQPILTSNGQGPSRGTLVWGRYLNAEELNHISKVVHLPVSVQTAGAATMSPDFQTAEASLTGDSSTCVSALGQDTIAGYSRLDDIFGNPALLLRIETPRDVFNQGQSTMVYFILAILAAGLTFAMITIFLLERTVISRMARISASAMDIGEREDHSARIQISGNDEVSKLAEVINKMLAGLERAQDDLFQAKGELDQRIVERTAQLQAMQTLAEQEQDRRGELSTLYGLSRILAETAPESGLMLDVITKQTVETINTTYAQVALMDDSELVIKAFNPIRHINRITQLGKQSPLSRLPVCAQILNQGEPVVVETEDDFSQHEREFLLADVAQTLCLVPLKTNGRALGLLILGEQRRTERETFTPEKLSLAKSIADQTVSALRRAELFTELECAYLQAVTALANAVDAKDTYTADHGKKLGRIAVAVGRELGMEPHELEDLQRGALLHDVGKIGVPDAILQKPFPLTEYEWEKIRLHPVIGEKILGAIPHLSKTAKIVRHHHERFDGQGYPDGISGKQIVLGARILNVVDSFSAIVDVRIYKKMRSRKEAIDELRNCSVKQFDPEVVEAFLRVLESGTIDEFFDDDFARRAV